MCDFWFRFNLLFSLHRFSGNEAFGMKTSQVGNKGSVVDFLSAGVYLLCIYSTNEICGNKR